LAALQADEAPAIHVEGSHLAAHLVQLYVLLKVLEAVRVQIIGKDL